MAKVSKVSEKSRANLTGGSRKGRPNKNSAAIKDMVLAALSESGGVEYLKQQAQAQPVAFMGLVGKVLPLQLSGDPHNPMRLLFGWMSEK